VLNAPDGVFNVNSLSGTGAVSPQGTYRPSNVMDCNWEFHIRHRVVLPSESVQHPNHQPRFQPNGTYGASNQTEVLGMFLGLRAFQLDHRIKSPAAHATTTNAFNAMRMGWFYINPRGVSTSHPVAYKTSFRPRRISSSLPVIQEESAAGGGSTADWLVGRLAQRTPPAARICFNSSVQLMTARRLLPCVPRRNMMNRPSRVTS